jgi:class 3 adenylate cyclase
MQALSQAPFEINLAGSSHAAQAIALAGPGGETVAWQVQLRGRDQVLALLDSIQQGFLLILITGMAVSVVFSFVIAGSVTRPLDSLVEATHQVEKGNFEFQLKVKSGDELGRVARSFNAMISELKDKERVKALFGKYLPKAVAERAMANPGELKLGGDLLEVTCLFSDIRGFTSMSERMPPQDIVSMLNDYYTRMIDVLFENDGTLDKTIGDAVMALFGAPVADAQAPAKAIRTGLGMLAELARFNEERKAKGLQPIEIGIGINTGQMVAGNLGSIKQFSYTVIGEEVNLAARLCGSAKAGQVLVSENTWRKVKWQFEFNRLEPISVKNVSQPVPVYEVLGEISGAVEPPAA